MKSQYHCLAVVVLTIASSTGASADQSGIAMLTENNYLNLDTGAISKAGGDVFWNGTALAAQGQAGLYNLGKFGSRASSSPLPPDRLHVRRMARLKFPRAR